MSGIMSKRTVDAVFHGLFLFTDLRQILRDTTPDHTLDDDQKKEVSKILTKLEKQVAILQEEMLS